MTTHCIRGGGDRENRHGFAIVEGYVRLIRWKSRQGAIKGDAARIGVKRYGPMNLDRRRQRDQRVCGVSVDRVRNYPASRFWLSNGYVLIRSCPSIQHGACRAVKSYGLSDDRSPILSVRDTCGRTVKFRNDCYLRVGIF